MSGDLAQNLAKHLASLIRGHGPLTVEQWMGQVLGHPELGYYMSAEPFGVKGDFTTSPEISQMFGEMLGLWAAHTWQQIGAPPLVHLVEIGPGRGTLMADALRAAAALPDFVAAIDVHLVETSPRLRTAQQAALGEYEITWHEDLAGVPAGPMILLCNELFDALPIRQFVHTAEGWRERLVDLDPDSSLANNADAPSFRFVASPGPSMAMALVDEAVQDAPEGSVAELCPSGLRLASEIASRLQSQGGAGLIIDYGYVKSQAGDTLQAVSKHDSYHVLAAPGQIDVCALVDFAMLGHAIREAGAQVSGLREQGEFLTALGIDTRAQILKANQPAAAAPMIDAALERLTGADAMGKLFKVMAITPAGAPRPAGFEDAE